MATAPHDRRLAAVRALAWALLIGGWLALGALGRQHTLRWAEGLLPLAAWLLTVGLAQRWAGERLMSGAAVRGAVAVSGLGAGAACLWSSQGGGAMAVFVAAVCWGLMLVAASRGVRLARGGGPRPPPPALSAALGAAAAWMWVGDPAAPLSVWSIALGLGGASAVLALLLPAHASGRGCRGGLFDCALPLDGLAWRDPSAWALQASRWSMLPMMATLALMAPWCGDFGGSPSAAVALHLAAMLGPPLLLQRLGPLPQATALATGAMVIGPLLLLTLPGVRGLMALSLVQSFAWGLFWHAQLSRAPSPAARARTGPLAAALPALAVAGIGLAAHDAGPQALSLILAALASVAGLGALASRAAALSSVRRALRCAPD